MTNATQHNDRDAVLYAFHQECSHPSLEDICRWIDRYPQFANDIRLHAAIARDWDPSKEGNLLETPDQATLDNAYSRALNIAYEAKQKRLTSNISASRSFQQLMAERGKDVPALANEIGHGIKRSVLADLVNGVMQPPIGPRLSQAVTNALSISLDVFNDALQVALGAPRMGHAKAGTAPVVKTRSYQEIVKDSGMNPEQQQYWLDRG